MPDTLDELLMKHPPSAERPLLGTVMLVVEDSRHACEAIRLIAQRSGARIRRAESLASAKRHLCAYRPSVALIDLGLPDGSGCELIEQLARSEPRIEAIIATSGDDTQKETALAAGADIFLPKPLASVSAFQSVVLSLLPDEQRPPHVAVPKNDHVVPDPIALRDDLALAADLLKSESDPKTLDYVAAFLASLGADSGDTNLRKLAEDVRVAAGNNDAKSMAQALSKRIENLAPV